MTPKEEAGFRAVYEQWPTDRLARAATLEKKDYQPEAVTLMLGVLGARGIAQENLSEVVASFPPPLPQPPERDTLLFPARLNRIQFPVRLLISAILIFGTAAFSEGIPMIQPAASVVVILGGLLYIVFGIYIPRLRDAGLSPLLLFLALVPVVNLVAIALLFAAPPKKAKTQTNQTPLPTPV